MSSPQTAEGVEYLAACPKLMGLLGRFHAGGVAGPAMDARMVEPTNMPQPYRRLLVHSTDMTSTLSEFYGESFQLRVLQHSITSSTLSRHVALVGQRSGRAVEYGAIRINLGELSEPIRDEVLACRMPLGGILRAHDVPFRSCPGAFFSVRSTELMERVLQMERPAWLYGRCNCIATPADRVMAEVVEILPPAPNDRTP